MNGPQLAVQMTFEESQAWFGIQKIINQQDKMKDGLGGISSEARKAAQEERRAAAEMERFAESVKRMNATPVQKHTEYVDKLNRALKAGKLTQEEVNRATARSAAALKDAGNAGESAFGADAIGQLAGFAGGLATIAGAVGVVKQAFAEMREEKEKALETAEGMSDPNRDLSQLATTPEEYEKLLARRDELATKYGIDRKTATDVLFSAQSAGLSDEETESAAKSGLLTDPRATTLLMGKVKSTFGDKITPEQALNVSIKAAAESPLNIQDLTDRMPEALNPAKELGLSYEETAAFIAKMSDHFSSGAQTIDRFTGLAGKMALSDDFKGQGMQGFDKLVNMSDEELKDIAGTDKEKNEALRAIRAELTKIKAYSQELQVTTAATGTSQDALSNQVKVRLSNPSETAKLSLRQHQAREEITRENVHATGEAELQIAVSKEMEKLNREGVGILSRFGAQKSMWLGQQVGAPSWAMPALSAAGRSWDPVNTGMLTLTRSLNPEKFEEPDELPTFGAKPRKPDFNLRPIQRGLMGAAAIGTPGAAATNFMLHHPAGVFGPSLDSLFGGSGKEDRTSSRSLRDARDRGRETEAKDELTKQTDLLASVDEKLGTMNQHMAGNSSRLRGRAAAVAATSERR